MNIHPPVLTDAEFRKRLARVMDEHDKSTTAGRVVKLVPKPLPTMAELAAWYRAGCRI